MRTVSKFNDVLLHTEPGELCSWKYLKKYSKSSRDVNHLLERGLLKKVGPGMYFRPKKTRFGDSVVNDTKLVKQFLKTEDFLLFSNSLYNGLGLGLTQLKNVVYVYNKKRHEVILLSNRKFYFKRPNNGYPTKLTAEFLLIDLINNINNLGTDVDLLLTNIKEKIKLGSFNNNLLLNLSSMYGKIATKKFFTSLLD